MKFETHFCVDSKISFWRRRGRSKWSPYFLWISWSKLLLAIKNYCKIYRNSMLSKLLIELLSRISILPLGVLLAILLSKNSLKSYCCFCWSYWSQNCCEYWLFPWFLELRWFGPWPCLKALAAFLKNSSNSFFISSEVLAFDLYWYL